MAKSATKRNGNGANLGFEQTLWAAADKLRGHLDAAEYKHVVLGLIFLKYISDAFEARRKQLLAEVGSGADPEDPDEYRAENVFWVPTEARWKRLQANAKDPQIGSLLDKAMDTIEHESPSLRGVLPRDYNKPSLDKRRLGELVDLISTIGFDADAHKAQDILGRTYEYFLGQFAGREGKKGGEFYTPRSVVRLLVEMLSYLMISDVVRNYIHARAEGSTNPHLNLSAIRNLPLPALPPMEEQRAIASVLGALDDKIELNRRMNETLEALARAIFTSWFVDFDPVRAKAEGRQPVGMDAETAALFPDSFEDSPLGPIPSGWYAGELGDVVSMNIRSRLPEHTHREIQYVDIASVTKGRLESTAPMPLDEAPSRARRLVKDGDVIWSCVRPNRRSYLLIDHPHPPENMIVSTGFVVLTPTAVPSSYLYLSVTTDEFVDYLTANADGARTRRFGRSISIDHHC